MELKEMLEFTERYSKLTDEQKNEVNKLIEELEQAEMDVTLISN